jgi:threonine dehydratase
MNAYSSCTLRSIKAAELLKEAKANLTPLLNSKIIDDKFGGVLLIKAENLQVGGSFKFRGAYNAIYNKIIASNPDEHKTSSVEKEVITCSSGNHAQAVALAAKMFKIKATVVMPNDSPKVKIDNTKLYGANIIFYDRSKDDRFLIAKNYSEKTGAIFIHPFDDEYVMAGMYVYVYMYN